MTMLVLACSSGSTSAVNTTLPIDTTATPTVTTAVPTRSPGPGPDVILPTATAVSSSTSTSSPQLATPTAMITPTTVPSTPTSIPAPGVTSTATLSTTTVPTLTPTSIPDPIATPQPPANLQFGVIASAPHMDYRLDQLGVDWFIDYSPDPRTAPAGTTKVPFVSVKPGKARLTPSDIAVFTTAAPGSTWYIGGEPNVPEQDGISPEAYVIELDYYLAEIRGADPTAKIMGPSILNWDFTCSGCGDFQSGKSWLEQFIDTYVFSHDGNPPPVDVWAIDVYPLTWDELPMTNWQIVRDQLIGFRQFLRDKVPGHANTPIWVTEIASHWGFDGLEFIDGVISIPAGQDFQDDFLWDEMIEFMDGIIGWMQDNAEAQNIGRWFFYKDWVDISQSASGGYAGIHLFESRADGAALNPLGQVYRDYATGQR